MDQRATAERKWIAAELGRVCPPPRGWRVIVRGAALPEESHALAQGVWTRVDAGDVVAKLTCLRARDRGDVGTLLPSWLVHLDVEAGSTSQLGKTVPRGGRAWRRAEQVNLATTSPCQILKLCGVLGTEAPENVLDLVARLNYDKREPGQDWLDRPVTGETKDRPGVVTNIGPTSRDGLARDQPVTPDASEWSGWRAALKPAHEPIVLARKPLDGTVAANVLAHGTGGLRSTPTLSSQRLTRPTAD